MIAHDDDELMLSLSGAEARIVKTALLWAANRCNQVASVREHDTAVSVAAAGKLQGFAFQCEHLAQTIDRERLRMRQLKRRTIDAVRARHASAHGTAAVEPRRHRGHGASFPQSPAPSPRPLSPES